MHKEVRWYCAVSALAILTLPGAAIARGADEPAGAAAALSGEPQDAAPQATQTDIATADQSSQGSEIVVTGIRRSEEHTSELQSLMRNSYAVFCLKKKKTHEKPNKTRPTN